MQDIALVPAYSHTATPATKRDLWLHQSSIEGEVFLLGVLSGGDGEPGNGRKGLVHIALKWAFSGKSIDFFRWQSSHLPLEGLCSRQQETQNDSFSRGVHPAVLVARAAARVGPH